MSRNFVNVSWSNSAENYDGYQQMNKHFNPNGSAAIHNYSDEALQKSNKKKKSVADDIDLAQRHYERMERMSDALEKEFEEGTISDPVRYEFLRKKMDQRLAKAWQRVEKERIAFGYESEFSYEEIPLENSLQRDGTSSTFLANVMESLSEENIFKTAYKIVKFIMETLK